MKLLPAVIIGILLALQVRSIAPPLFQPASVIVEAQNMVTPTPTPTDKEVIDEVVRVFAPEGRHVVIKALNCFYSESGLRWNAINDKNKNGSIDGGVAQLNDVWKLTLDERLNYRINIQKAYEIYKRSGWRPWFGVGCK